MDWGHDPYYMVGNEQARIKGEWFADLYKQYWHTLTDPIVRSLHYAILHHTVYLPDEKTRYFLQLPYSMMVLIIGWLMAFIAIMPQSRFVEMKSTLR